jgi:hypothetical protein
LACAVLWRDSRENPSGWLGFHGDVAGSPGGGKNLGAGCGLFARLKPDLSDGVHQ